MGKTAKLQASPVKNANTSFNKTNGFNSIYNKKTFFRGAASCLLQPRSSSSVKGGHKSDETYGKLVRTMLRDCNVTRRKHFRALSSLKQIPCKPKHNSKAPLVCLSHNTGIKPMINDIKIA
eukprot:TRINITY_DN1177_c0_g4_i1.p1 TRINITY_DN1177_c0_g4~~TRINITY_DN1177_c0_g4_i1.p1  ORF type:complete len:121 (-),score=23.32 TRINITY_DN1177_c0_g4_i1:156-518(-)